MKRISLCRCLCAVLVSLLVVDAQAQNIGLQSHSQNGVTYISGGIADDQQKALAIMRDDYDLQLTFAEQGTGAYLADIQVEIQSASGVTFVNAKSDGPLFLARLAEGTYRVKATHGDKSQVKQVSIAKGALRELVFYW